MRQLFFSYTINSKPDDVWQIIATDKGIRKYMSEDIRVELRVGGAYEIYFDMEMPEGLRGSEGMSILCLEENSRFGHTWNNPPSIPELRDQLTVVYYELTQHFGNQTRLDFYHVGFGESEGWDKAYAYFSKAWGEIVLPRLIESCEKSDEIK